jgi:hypothetical protein
MKTVKDIVREYLLANGADGLCTDDCGCSVDDLAPCGDCSDCIVAMDVGPKNGYDRYFEPKEA